MRQFSADPNAVTSPDDPTDQTGDNAAAVNEAVDGGDEGGADEDDVDESKWPDIHREALLEYERAWQREYQNIAEAYDDLKFRRGRVSDQWDPNALSERQGRPTHVNNKIPQFIRQVTGDQRQMRPSIQVVPVDSTADVDVAEVRGGIIRYVENRSHAKWIYNQGGDSQVACGIGHWQVTTEYANAGTFAQEIRIELVEDGVAVLWDADAVQLTREDANHCFVPLDKTTALFKREWPDAVADGFDTSLAGSGTTAAFDSWATDDYIRVVVYWKKMPKDRYLALMPDGAIVDMTAEVEKLDKAALKKAIAGAKAQGIRLEKRKSYELRRFLMTMSEILEEKAWKGMHIPVVPIIGEEVRIAREVYRAGLVRPVKDLQRMVNYYASAETEVVALQPKAPFLGTKKMFQDRYDLWDTANTENHPFLEYTPDPLVPGGKPERIKPPVASEAIQQGAINASNDMKAVLGIYDAGLGQKSNETSGVAIKNRAREGDTGTFLYIDNMALAIMRTGVIVDDLAPHIYDTQRQLRIIGDDAKAQVVTLNKVVMIDGKQVVENDLSVGSYDVQMEQGPSYTTRREESRDSMQAFIQAVPAAAPLVGDLIAKAQDWPQAQEFGERLQEMLPPPIKAKLEAEKQAREQASGKPPKPPSPQQLQQIQQQQAAAQKQQALQDQEIALKMREQAAKADEREAAARKMNAEADLAEAKAAAYKQELAGKHMDEIRKIESHDHAIEDTVQARAHAQDRHETGMVHGGIEAHGKLQSAVNNQTAASAQLQAANQDMDQSSELHSIAIDNAQNPPAPAAAPAPGG